MIDPRRKANGEWRKDIARSAGSSFVLCMLLLTPGLALAQAGADPTRPPTGLGAAADMDAVDAGGGIMLQSVIISPAGKAAIISGVMVKLGEKYGDAVLVKVAESEVELKSGTTSQVLKLYPGVEMRDTVPAAPKSAPHRAKARSKAAPADGGSAPPR